MVALCISAMEELILSIALECCLRKTSMFRSFDCFVRFALSDSFVHVMEPTICHVAADNVISRSSFVRGPLQPGESCRELSSALGISTVRVIPELQFPKHS